MTILGSVFVKMVKNIVKIHTIVWIKLITKNSIQLYQKFQLQL